MKNIVFILFLLFLFSCRDKTTLDNPLRVDVSSDIVDPKHYIVAKIRDEMIIDGQALETAWQKAPYTDYFIDIEGVKAPKYNTRCKMLWDEEFLYVYAKLEEPHIWGDLKQRDTVIFYNNDFEVFISPSASTWNYAEIEINSLGTVWDLLLDKPYRDGGYANTKWNLDQLKTAVYIVGTINNHEDIDSFWTVEMGIPLSPLLKLKNGTPTIPEEGELWRINFSRVQWDYDIVNGMYRRKKKENGEYYPEYNWVWSPQKVINMHEPEKWGTLQFSQKYNIKNTTKVEDKNMLYKQVAYALFRQTKFGKLKYLQDKEPGSIINLKVKYTDNEHIDAVYYKTNFGFEYRVEGEQSKKDFIINHRGRLKTMK